jgi:hypothetical protein
MIRIDEIYNNTFWPWLEQHRPGTRLFFCDPPGNTSPDALFNLGSDDIIENDYIFCHDQEPIHLDQFEPLFRTVCARNQAMWDRPIQNNTKPIPFGHVIVSERGQYLEELCEKYQWQPHYYFYHGWACLDWFRGYDKTYLIPRAKDRAPTKTFMSPNRIVAGKRDHRVLFLYNVFRRNLQNNHISAPRICQYERIDIAQVASKYNNTYPDIEQVFNRAELPRVFRGEAEQQMTSCWLSNFEEAADSLIYVPTETVYFGRRQHLTEKTFKAIALEMPFMLVAPQHSLEYLRSYGFQTFAPYIDESYDSIEDPILRIEKITEELANIQTLDSAKRQRLHKNLLPIVEHNYNHFYSGGFERILWAELQAMLKEFE